MAKLTRYKRQIFDESFTSQRDVYIIAEHIESLIETPIKRALKEYIESGNNEVKVSNYYFTYIDDGVFNFTFNFSTLLDKIHAKESNPVVLLLKRFYENYIYASLRITFSDSKKNEAGYEVRNKNIEVNIGKEKYGEFIEKLNNNNYNHCFLIMTYYNKLKSLLIHELTHLYDDVISKEKAVTGKAHKYKSANVDVEGYLKNQIEVNARFYPAVYDNGDVKLQALTSDRGLKRIWSREYLPQISNELHMNILTKEQQKKMTNRIWVEFTTLDKQEELLLSYMSLQVMINNGDLKGIDVRIKNKSKVVKKLKDMLLDLSNGKVSQKLFSSTEPFLNDEWQQDLKLETEYSREIVKLTKWAEAEAYFALYENIQKSSDKFYFDILKNLCKGLRLDISIISDIIREYNINVK